MFLDNIIGFIKRLFGKTDAPSKHENDIVDIDPGRPFQVLAFSLKKYPKDENSYMFYEIIFDPITVEVYITPDITSKRILEIIDEVNSVIRLEVEHGKDVYEDKVVWFLEDKFSELVETTPIFKDKGLKIIYGNDDYIEEE